MLVQRVREMELRFKPLRLPLPVEAQILEPREAAQVLAPLLADSPVEKAVALHLNAKRRVVGVHTFSVGTADSTMVIPRDVLTAAMMLPVM